MNADDAQKPYNIPAETAVIGAILIDPSAYSEVAHLTPEMFGKPVYRLAWKAILELAHEGVTPDVVTVDDRMHALNEHVAQDAYLITQAVAETPTFHNIRHYANDVLRCYQQRAIMDAALRMTAAAHNQADPTQIIQQSLMRLSRIGALNPDAHTGRITYPQIIDRLQEDTFERQVDRMEHPNDPRLSFLTGFGALDRATGGFEPGDLVLLASRSGGGKSGFGLSVGRRVGARYHRTGFGTVDYLTMEMSALAQARRIIGHYGNIDSLTMRKGFVAVDEVDVAAYHHFLSVMRLDVDLVGDALGFYEQVMTTDQLAVFATQGKANRDLRFLIVDQLNLFADSSREGERIRMSNMSRALKQLAMRLGIVILCMVQLNREVEKYADKRPTLANIKESDNLGNDADIVLSLHRPSYYFDTPIRNGTAFEKWAELNILKYRNGNPDISIPLEFDRGFFTDWDAESWPVAEMRRLVARVEKGEAA